MYQPLLTNRYLTSRVIPLIAVAAVGLCVALVIIVVSVMTGFLDMVRSSGRTLMGDVVVAHPVTGIPHYERLIAHIEKLPAAEAATPVVDGWGLLRMPYPDGPHKQVETVQVWCVEPQGFARVTGYAGTLYWRVHPPGDLEAMAEDDPRRLINLPAEDRPLSIAERLERDGLALRHFASGRPGIVLGIHVSEANQRQEDGSIRPLLGGYWWMPHHEVTLTVLPLDTGGGAIQPESERFPVVNEFASGVFLIDDKRVIIPLEVGQGLLRLDEGIAVDETRPGPDGVPVEIGVDPARATMVLARAREGFTPQQLREQVEKAYQGFHAEVVADGTAVVKPPRPGPGVSIRTWEEQQAQFLGPIEKERELMRTLFSLVYLVCAGLVLSIFWAIVYEKTRDIGILRSIGASRLGVSWIFLRYGLVTGVAGAAVGVGLAYLIVHNINVIHKAMGDPPAWLAWLLLGGAVVAAAVTAYRGRRGDLLPITLGALVTVTGLGLGAIVFLVKRQGGFVIWDPTVYYFTVIPNRVDVASALFTTAGAVVFSLIGAFLPAAKAADTDPVRALRYE
jgi:lipoprotein-releasing system permease protein